MAFSVTERRFLLGRHKENTDLIDDILMFEIWFSKVVSQPV